MSRGSYLSHSLTFLQLLVQQPADIKAVPKTERRRQDLKCIVHESEDDFQMRSESVELLHITCWWRESRVCYELKLYKNSNWEWLHSLTHSLTQNAFMSLCVPVLRPHLTEDTVYLYGEHGAIALRLLAWLSRNTEGQREELASVILSNYFLTKNILFSCSCMCCVMHCCCLLNMNNTHTVQPLKKTHRLLLCLCVNRSM